MCSRYIYPEVFEHFYDPTAFPRETCVLYKIRWNRSKRTWMNWCENQSNEHAEIYFLQHLCGEIERRREWDACTVTWYLSWTPCGGCSKRIIAFLHQNPHVVALKIRAARLYRGNRERNRHGLRALSSHPRIRLSIMSPGGKLISLYRAQQMEEGRSQRSWKEVLL